MHDEKLRILASCLGAESSFASRASDLQYLASWYAQPLGAELTEDNSHLNRSGILVCTLVSFAASTSGAFAVLQPFPHTLAGLSVGQCAVGCASPEVADMSCGYVKFSPPAAQFVCECQHRAVYSGRLTEMAWEEWRVEARVVDHDFLSAYDLQYAGHQLIKPRFATHHIVVDAVYLRRLPGNAPAWVDQGIDQCAARTIDDGYFHDGIAPCWAEAGSFGVEVKGHGRRRAGCLNGNLCSGGWDCVRDQILFEAGPRRQQGGTKQTGERARGAGAS
jgi:hypothetical protein